MASPLTAQALLDREFLEIRCRLLDIASSLDRIDAGTDAQDVANDERLAHIRDALCILAEETPGALPEATSDRTARVQMVFSDSYDERWRS